MVPTLPLLRPLLALLLISFLSATALAASPPDVKAANAALKRAETNLQLVDGSIGHLTAPPKGSAAKLSRMRLKMGKSDLDAAGKLVDALKSGAGVAETKKRYESAKALHAKLEGILSGAPPKPAPQPAPKPTPKPKPGPTPKPGTPAPAPAPAPKPAPAPAKPATVKLGYPHADNFKSTLFTLRRVEQDTAAVTQVVQQCKSLKDALDANHRVTAGAVERTIEGQRQAGFVQTGLNKIPANGEGVAEAKERLATANASLKSALEYLQPLNAKLTQIVNPASYPALQTDLRRLQDFSSTYRDPQSLFQAQRAAAADAFSQMEAARSECQRIHTTYARLIQQDTGEGQRVDGSCKHVMGKLDAFAAAAVDVSKSLPAEIRRDMEEVERVAGEAVANQKPMWFTGGIPQQMGWIDEKLELLQALDPTGGEKMAQEVKALKDGLAVQADSLKTLIIQQNPLPNDSYQGADRDAIVAIAKDGWKHQEPDFELLAVRIPAESWKRETKWTYSNGTWYFVDVSRIQVRLIVADKENPEQAIDRPVNVRKDHQNGDKLIGVPMRSIDERLQPNEYLLRSRIK